MNTEEVCRLCGHDLLPTRPTCPTCGARVKEAAHG